MSKELGTWEKCLGTRGPARIGGLRMSKLHIHPCDYDEIFRLRSCEIARPSRTQSCRSSVSGSDTWTMGTESGFASKSKALALSASALDCTAAVQSYRI